MKNPQGSVPDDRPSAGAAGEPFDALFEDARADGFTDAEKARLWQGLAVSGLAPPRGESAGGSGAGRLFGAGGKALAALVATGAVVGALYVRGAAPRAPAAPDTVTRIAPRDRPQAAPPVGSAPEPPQGPAPAEPPVFAWDELPRTPWPAGTARPARPRAELRAPVGDAPRSDASDPLEARDAPSDPAEAEPSEGTLLLRARQQVVARPAAALELTREAGERYPGGPLAPEREALAIEALSRLGRSAEARARLAAFRARYPRSPLLERLSRFGGSP